MKMRHQHAAFALVFFDRSRTNFKGAYNHLLYRTVKIIIITMIDLIYKDSYKTEKKKKKT